MLNLTINLGYYRVVQRIIGKIAGFHGLKGEIKIFPLIDNLAIFKELEEIFINGQNYKLLASRPHKNTIMVKLEGINDLTAAEKLNGHVEAEIADDQQDGGYYIADLMDLVVKDETGKEIGRVSNYSSEAQDHIFIKLNEEYAAKSELILPFVDEYILEVIAGDHIKINLDKDLLEICC